MGQGAEAMRGRMRGSTPWHSEGAGWGAQRSLRAAFTAWVQIQPLMSELGFQPFGDSVSPLIKVEMAKSDF